MLFRRGKPVRNDDVPHSGEVESKAIEGVEDVWEWHESIGWLAKFRVVAPPQRRRLPDMWWKFLH